MVTIFIAMTSYGSVESTVTRLVPSVRYTNIGPTNFVVWRQKILWACQLWMIYRPCY